MFRGDGVSGCGHEASVVSIFPEDGGVALRFERRNFHDCFVSLDWLASSFPSDLATGLKTQKKVLVYLEGLRRSKLNKFAKLSKARRDH